MRTSPYCGKQYSEDVWICPNDQQPLGGREGRHESFTGTWRGSYNYLSNLELDVPFTLQLRQDAPAHVTGTVTEDVNLGMPGTGTIDGTIAFPHIEFVKKMPVCYMAGPDGQFMKLREWLAAQDLVCEGDPPHPSVVYKGEFNGNDEARGMWVIEPWEILLGGWHVFADEQSVRELGD